MENVDTYSIMKALRLKMERQSKAKGVYGGNNVLIRILYILVAMAGYVLTAGGRLRCNKAVVLCYHGVLPKQREQFKRQMARLSGCGGRSPKVFITFDDAFENLLDNALPLLNEFRIPAIVFAVPGNFGQSPKWSIAAEHPEYNEKVMTEQQLKSISSDLIKIGSHTQTHPNLSTLSGEDVRWELTESKKNLEKLLDGPVEDLALPHGAYNTEVLRIAQEAGYKRIYTLEPKMVRESQEMGVIGRFSTSPDVWRIEFYLTCAGAYSWLFPFRKLLKKFSKNQLLITKS
jgi:peptidoglycan/xylan/chitin deacetylase (PgdA/CDA1 family)